MSTSLINERAMYGPFQPERVGLGRISLTGAPSRTGFLRFVWLAMVLSVVAILEPSPGDIGIALLALVGFIFGKLSWKNIPVLPVALLSLFVTSNLVSLCFAIDVPYAASFALITAFMLTFWFFTLGVATKFEERGVRTIMSAYTTGGMLSAGFGLLAYFGFLSRMSSSLPVIHTLQLDETLLYFGQRMRGFFKDPNVFGPYMVVIAAYALCQLQSLRNSMAQKICWTAACLIASLSVLLSFSRAAWVNYVITLAIVAALNTLTSHRQNRSRRSVITLLIVGAFVATAVGYALTSHQVNEIAVDRSEKQSYDEDRFIKQVEALELGLTNPLGIGPGQSQLVLSYNPHSLPLGLFAENGVVGVLSVMAFVVGTLIRSFLLSLRATNQFQRSIFILVTAAIAGTLLNSLVIDPIHWRHFWFLLALGWMPLWVRSDSSPKERRSPERSRQLLPNRTEVWQ
jgi:O-antigen ligase